MSAAPLWNRNSILIPLGIQIVPVELDIIVAGTPAVAPAAVPLRAVVIARQVEVDIGIAIVIEVDVLHLEAVGGSPAGTFVRLIVVEVPSRGIAPLEVVQRSDGPLPGGRVGRRKGGTLDFEHQFETRVKEVAEAEAVGTGKPPDVRIGIHHIPVVEQSVFDDLHPLGYEDATVEAAYAFYRAIVGVGVFLGNPDVELLLRAHRNAGGRVE